MKNKGKKTITKPNNLKQNKQNKQNQTQTIDFELVKMYHLSN